MYEIILLPFSNILFIYNTVTIKFNKSFSFTYTYTCIHKYDDDPLNSHVKIKYKYIDNSFINYLLIM